MKRILSFILCIAVSVSMFSLSACAGGATGRRGAQIGIVTDVGELMDKGFNQGTYEGVKAYAEANGKTYKYYQPANGNNASDNDRIAAMRQAINNGAEIVCINGFLQAAAIETVASEFPDVKIIFVDGWVMPDHPNVTAITYKEHESSYLAGYAAVKEGYTKLGGTFGGGGSHPPCNRFGYGFVQGADAAAREMDKQITINYSYKFGDTFSASSELQAQMASWYAQGCEVIFCAGGSMFDSVKSAAAAYPNAKIIGVDVDQSKESEKVITSATKGLKESIVQVLGKFYDGKWDSELSLKEQNLGAKENAVGLPTDTWSMKNFTVDEYKALFEKIKNGTIVPKSNVPENGNNGAWLQNGLTNTTIRFE